MGEYILDYEILREFGGEDCQEPFRSKGNHRDIVSLKEVEKIGCVVLHEDLELKTKDIQSRKPLREEIFEFESSQDKQHNPVGFVFLENVARQQSTHDFIHPSYVPNIFHVVTNRSKNLL